MSACQHVLSYFIGAVFLISVTACGEKQQIETTVSAAQIKPADLTKENDKVFLVRAAEMKYEQILLAKLARQRSSSESIKTLATQLEEANRNEKSALASLGIVKSIAVPAAPTAAAHAAYDTLNTAGVEEFDAAYITFVIEGYEQAIRHFEQAGNASLDPDIKVKAAAMLPEMKQYLTKAIDVDAGANATADVTTVP